VIARFSREKQGDRILFGYGGDRLCKCSTTGRAIAHPKKASVISQSQDFSDFYGSKEGMSAHKPFSKATK
jgi:hypothetical protein